MSTATTNGRPRGRTAPPAAPASPALDLIAMLETELARERAIAEALARQQGRVEALRELLDAWRRLTAPTPEDHHAPSPDHPVPAAEPDPRD